MKPFRAACVAPLAMLAVLVAGCSADTDSDAATDATNGGDPKTTQSAPTSEAGELDGVRFDVRRDPG